MASELFFRTRCASWALNQELEKQGFDVRKITAVEGGFIVLFVNAEECADAAERLRNQRIGGRRIHEVRQWLSPARA